MFVLQVHWISHLSREDLPLQSLFSEIPAKIKVVLWHTVRADFFKSSWCSLVNTFLLFSSGLPRVFYRLCIVRNSGCADTFVELWLPAHCELGSESLLVVLLPALGNFAVFSQFMFLTPPTVWYSCCHRHLPCIMQSVTGATWKVPCFQ